MKNLFLKLKRGNISGTLYLVFCIVFLGPLCCKSGSIVDAKTGRPKGAQGDASSGYYFDDIARYLGGFEIPADSKLKPFTENPDYALHREKMAAFWNKVRTQNINPVKEWRDTVLYKSDGAPVCRSDRAAFYPLSGADIINLYTMCPYASEYIMVALEKAGDIPHPEKNSPRYYQGLRNMRSVINNIADRNYFFSAHMKTNIVKNTEIPGIAPVLLAFTSGIGWRIVTMEKIYLSPSGGVIVAPEPNSGNSTPSGTPGGVRIWFRTDTDSRLRSLTYIEQYLDSAAVSPDYPLTKFLAQKRGAFMMLKAAVYLMHNNFYNSVRDFFITIPDVIVQDDSGFKYTYLRDAWNIQIYGSFTGPAIRMSVRPQNPVQPELAKFYKEQKPQELPFNFGYGSLRKPPRSNLMVARRKQA
ncbi:MAG: hypothetical protein LDLANPLL_02679 [Turneriella sp.]|nr:hypothetical protein [Turneriella sp.]